MIIALVPAYNEEKKVGSVVRQLKEYVDEVVVIDDGSEDSTFEQARRAGAVVISHTINRGQGAALQTGHDYAREVHASYVIHFDGDGQFDATDIASAMRKMYEQRVDILLGSRFLSKQSSIPWFKRYVQIPCSKLVNRIFVRSVQLSDVHNGFRIVSAAALDRVVLEQDRMAHATEIYQLIARYDLSYVEHPITVEYHRYGQGIGGGFRVVKDLVIDSFIRM